ncbi:MAG: class I SAM-dependent methyltransferase [Planctomycetes bacterium]|nr:class I SAM-dependent methyltransferase [Planctomycetota bacterium]
MQSATNPARPIPEDRAPVHGVTPLLDRVHRRLSSGEVGTGMRDLFTGLLDARQCATGESWRRLARQVAIEHPLRRLIHQDPMCRRSYDKPRGYAGDAVLLDYIYRILDPADASSIGRAIYDYNTGRPAARAVRHRREWIAFTIDRVAEQAPVPARVLSIACGHLREAELSAAMRNAWLEEVVALDSDPDSLRVAAAHAPGPISTVEMSVGRLMARPDPLGRFDLVYSAGLFDYLDLRVATRLVETMFAMLRPGGRLLFSNFLPTVPDAGYMESYMGWDLIYRDHEQLAETFATLPRDDIAESRVYSDPYASIGYVEVVRR